VASSTAEQPFLNSKNRQKTQRLKAIESSVPLIKGTAQHLIERFVDILPDLKVRGF
jgi:hypothetical protein